MMAKHFFFLPLHWCVLTSQTPFGQSEFWMHSERQSWALSVFVNFFNNKKCPFCIYYKVNDQLLHQSYLKSPLPVKLT